MAVWNRRPGEGVIHHSDHGCQYTSLLFGKRCQAVGIRCSMGSVGDSSENLRADQREQGTTPSSTPLCDQASIEGALAWPVGLIGWQAPTYDATFVSCTS